MKYVIYLSAVLLALFVSHAQAQYIEIRYEVTIKDHSSYRFGRSVLIFDTSVAPELSANGTLSYHAISGHYYVDASFRFSTPFKVLDEAIDVFQEAFLNYDPSLQEVTVYTVPTTGRYMSISISEVSDGFFEGMESLPDDPESYAMVDDYERQYIVGSIQRSQTSWDPKEGFLGGAVTYGARLVTELEPEPCSPADMNADGIVDFFDISSFIQVFLAACP